MPGILAGTVGDTNNEQMYGDVVLADTESYMRLRMQQNRDRWRSLQKVYVILPITVNQISFRILPRIPAASLSVFYLMRYLNKYKRLMHRKVHQPFSETYHYVI